MLVGCGTTDANTVQENEEKETTQSSNDTGATQDMNGQADELSEGTAEESYDDAFLSDFSESLQARWELIAKQDEESNGEELSDYDIIKNLETLIDCELQILDDVREKRFQDKHLQEYAIGYLNSLETQKELLEDYGTKDFDEKWDDNLAKRYEQIINIYDNYDVKLDSKYTSDINGIRNRVYATKIGDAGMWDILNENIVDDLRVEENDDGLDTIKILRTNWSKYDFKDLPLVLVLSKEDGESEEVIEEIPYTVGLWKAGEEIQLSFKRTKPDDGSQVTVTLYVN